MEPKKHQKQDREDVGTTEDAGVGGGGYSGSLGQGGSVAGEGKSAAGSRTRTGEETPPAAGQIGQEGVDEEEDEAGR